MFESEIQRHVVSWLKAKGITHQVALEGAKRHPAEAAKLKRMGMAPGNPDITLFFKKGKCVFIELKSKNGRLTDAQRARHDELRSLGFDVHTVHAATGAGAIDAIQDILDGLPKPRGEYS